MPSLKALKSSTAEAFDWPLSDITYRMRYLQEAGLIPKGKAGTGGAVQATPEHAALLLLSMGAAVDAKNNAVPLVKVIGGYTNTNLSRPPDWLNRDLAAALTSGTLTDVLANLLTVAAEDPNYLNELVTIKVPSQMSTVAIDVAGIDGNSREHEFYYSDDIRRPGLTGYVLHLGCSELIELSEFFVERNRDTA